MRRLAKKRPEQQPERGGGKSAQGKPLEEPIGQDEDEPEDERR